MLDRNCKYVVCMLFFVTIESTLLLACFVVFLSSVVVAVVVD